MNFSCKQKNQNDCSILSIHFSWTQIHKFRFKKEYWKFTLPQLRTNLYSTRILPVATIFFLTTSVSKSPSKVSDPLDHPDSYRWWVCFFFGSKKTSRWFDGVCLVVPQEFRKKFQEKNQNLQWQQHDDWLQASADAPPFLLAPSTTTSTPNIKLDTSSVHLENQNPKNNIPLKKKGIDDSLHLWISSVYACMHSLSNNLVRKKRHNKSDVLNPNPLETRRRRTQCERSKRIAVQRDLRKPLPKSHQLWWVAGAAASNLKSNPHTPDHQTP